MQKLLLLSFVLVGLVGCASPNLRVIDLSRAQIEHVKLTQEAVTEFAEKWSADIRRSGETEREFQKRISEDALEKKRAELLKKHGIVPSAPAPSEETLSAFAKELTEAVRQEQEKLHLLERLEEGAADNVKKRGEEIGRQLSTIQERQEVIHQYLLHPGIDPNAIADILTRSGAKLQQ